MPSETRLVRIPPKRGPETKTFYLGGDPWAGIEAVGSTRWEGRKPVTLAPLRRSLLWAPEAQFPWGASEKPCRTHLRVTPLGDRDGLYALTATPTWRVAPAYSSSHSVGAAPRWRWEHGGGGSPGDPAEKRCAAGAGEGGAGVLGTALSGAVGGLKLARTRQGCRFTYSASVFLNVLQKFLTKPP